MNSKNGPNWQKATVEPSKLIEYLLSFTHPRGRTKAVFFMNVGFTLDNWRDLSNALIKHAAEGDKNVSENTAYGVLYKIEGSVIAPNDRIVFLRSIWLVKHDDNVPKFITAYPIK